MQTKAEMLVLVCLFVPAFSVSCTSCHPRSPVHTNGLHSHPHLLLCPLGPRRAGPSRRRPEVARMCGSIARFRRSNESDDTFDRLRAERDLARAQLDARREEVARLETQLELKRMQLNVSVLQARVMELEHEKHAQQESDTEEEAVRHDADTSALETGACTLKNSRKQPTVTDNHLGTRGMGPGCGKRGLQYLARANEAANTIPVFRPAPSCNSAFPMCLHTLYSSSDHTLLFSLLTNSQHDVR